MIKIYLTIKEKGRYVEIPGLASFRTPARVDVTKTKISILQQALHKAGVSDYEISSSNEIGETIKYNKHDFQTPDKKKNDETSNLESRLEKLESLLTTLISNNDSKENKNSEQNTNNKLDRIERLLKSGHKFEPLKESSFIKTPVKEDIDDQFIPTIDINNMQMTGKTIEVVEKTSKEDIEDAVSLLSGLTNKYGGKK